MTGRSETRYAVAKKNGRMNNAGQIFCYEGKTYAYYIRYGADIYPYHVSTEYSPPFSHGMSEDFFHEYFKPLIDEIFLSKKDFEI